MRSGRAANLAVRYLAAVLSVAVMLVAACNIAIWSSASGRVHGSVAEVTKRDVALVFGAGVRDVDGNGLGTPSRALKDRMDAAIELFHAGKVDHLLVSGDNSRDDYDEPTIMRRLAIQGGVPASKVTVDYAGFDTSDSCVRAREVFGVTSAILVTQNFHIARATFLCRRAGIDPVGFSVSDSPFRKKARLILRFREMIAAPKAWWEGYVDSAPTYLGEFVGLVGSEDPANSDPEVDG